VREHIPTNGATIHELDELIALWRQDPCYDLFERREDGEVRVVEGFEFFAHQLEEAQTRFWEERELEFLRRAAKVTHPELVRRLERLERELGSLQEQLLP